MATSWDKLGQATSVMQLTGVDAFGLVSMILQAAHTARRNRDLCQQLAQRVQTVSNLLGGLQIPELRRHPETRRPLDQLDDALFRAYRLVRSCRQQQNRSQLYQMLTGDDVASKLRLAKEEIDGYIILIPMITAVAAVKAREVPEDVNNYPAPNQRPRLSLQEVTKLLEFEELPPEGRLPMDREVRRNDWNLVKKSNNRLLGWSVSRFLPNRVTSTVVRTERTPFPEWFRSFSYKELWQATQGFSEEGKLGDFGGFYRGFLQDQGLHVAIIKRDSRMWETWLPFMDVEIICRLRHPNLVQLVGGCDLAGEVLLVYELWTNCCLDTHLYGSRSILTWPIRYKIILGMCEALVFLHQSDVEHGYLRPSNVTLDSSFNAKLIVVGLAKLIGPDAQGAIGYEIPTVCSDVYDFGVILLEIACGRSIFSQERGSIAAAGEESSVHLVKWVRGLYSRGALLDAADPRLSGRFEARQMQCVLILGLWCTHPEMTPPTVEQALKVLHRFEEPLPVLPLPMPVTFQDDNDHDNLEL